MCCWMSSDICLAPSVTAVSNKSSKFRVKQVVTTAIAYDIIITANNKILVLLFNS